MKARQKQSTRAVFHRREPYPSSALRSVGHFRFSSDQTKALLKLEGLENQDSDMSYLDLIRFEPKDGPLKSLDGSMDLPATQFEISPNPDMIHSSVNEHSSRAPVDHRSMDIRAAPIRDNSPEYSGPEDDTLSISSDDLQPENQGDWAQQGSHTFSVTWVAPHVLEKERFQGILKEMSRIAPTSEASQWEFQHWLKHRLVHLDSQKEYLEKRLRFQELSKSSKPINPVMGGKVFEEGRSAVLALETIWCKWPTDEKDKGAAWPEREEWKWEGDDRARTGVQRFPPIPRKPGNDTVVWHMRDVVRANELDEVRKVPKPVNDDGDVELPMEENDSFLHYVGTSLWDEIET
ncbi:MAG: Diphthamide biosynthesis protein 3 [Chaenotheca gracillima]|nr:MAG: Diphthamide biosynthesis protein 3 [Chaenotheca gracillima]